MCCRFQSVVSAKVDPDTITVSRSHTDELAVISRQVGTKQTQTVMAGTKLYQGTALLKQVICLRLHFYSLMQLYIFMYLQLYIFMYLQLFIFLCLCG